MAVQATDDAPDLLEATAQAVAHAGAVFEHQRAAALRGFLVQDSAQRRHHTVLGFLLGAAGRAAEVEDHAVAAEAVRPVEVAFEGADRAAIEVVARRAEIHQIDAVQKERAKRSGGPISTKLGHYPILVAGRPPAGG